MKREILTRRNLPHWYVPNAAHFITFRLAGTIPREVLERIESRKLLLLSKPSPHESKARLRERVHKQLFAEYDQYLDRNHEIHWLDDPRLSALVRCALYYWHGTKYGLLCWCVMPNHVHVLLQPFAVDTEQPIPAEAAEPGEINDSDSPLAKIMHSLKSYTAHEANKLLDRNGQFWQHESYDHWVRDETELDRIVAYINANPVKAGLAARPHEFHWCSAHDRFLFDGDSSGCLSSDALDEVSRSFRQSDSDTSVTPEARRPAD